MSLWSAASAAAALGLAAPRGRDWQATGLSIDSRSLRPGDLFVALSGPNFDGHDYVGDAFAKGAVAAIVSKPPRALDANCPLLTVPDTMTALVDLGRTARWRGAVRCVGVTGSVGKTGTRAALAQTLAPHGRVHATQGNLNNHIGVPLTLARMPIDAEWGVLEMGMNHAGEIAALTRMVEPEVAIITAVEAVHIENFEDVAGIADAKAEILLGVPPTGSAILPRDNPHYPRLLAAARTAGIGQVLTFGDGAPADAFPLETRLDDRGAFVRAQIAGQVLEYTLPLPGRHWVRNSLAVLLGVVALGLDPAPSAAALAGLEAPERRGTRLAVSLAGGGSAIVIDDSYNASPPSMRAAFDLLAMIEPGPGGRRIAVLGDMLELGGRGPDLHRGLAEAVERAGIARLHACGPLMGHLMDAIGTARRGIHAPDAQALAPAVLADLRDGDVVLVKGSAGSRMGTVVAALRASGPPARANGG